MSHVPFILGCLMIGYDAVGHLMAAIARLSGPAGAYYWNNYSTYIWPRITDLLQYDIFWSIWHGTAILLFVTAYLVHGSVGNTVEIQKKHVGTALPIMVFRDCGKDDPKP